jgi:hypothetical protein
MPRSKKCVLDLSTKKCRKSRKPGRPKLSKSKRKYKKRRSDYGKSRRKRRSDYGKSRKKPRRNSSKPRRKRRSDYGKSRKRRSICSKGKIDPRIASVLKEEPKVNATITVEEDVVEEWPPKQVVVEETVIEEWPPKKVVVEEDVIEEWPPKKVVVEEDVLLRTDDGGSNSASSKAFRMQLDKAINDAEAALKMS